MDADEARKLTQQRRDAMETEVYNYIRNAAKMGRRKIVVNHLSEKLRRELIAKGYDIEDGYRYVNREGEQIIQQHISW